MINIQNDISNIYRLINTTFRKFYLEEPVIAINTDNYFNFYGIDAEIIEKLYDESNLNNLIPYDLNPWEVFIILTVTGAFYYPDLFQAARFLQKTDNGSFSIIGGKVVGDNKCFYPTGETILFLLAGHDISRRLLLEDFLSPESMLFTLGLIDITASEQGTPRLSGQLFPSPELITLLGAKKYRPDFTSNFPASRLETKMEWEDLVLPYETHEALEELRIWMKHGHKIMQHKQLGKRLKPGYRTLFYGPPGTGKTLTAALLGKYFNSEVYRIDLSMVVSKWVGETEKNLRGIFDQAFNKKWILFFDEADSLFGKRTQTSSSNDRYANQEVSYLLQRIEDFPGLVILASNLKSNIDEAFNRRFQSAIYFPMPDSETRYILWKKAFPVDFPLEEKINLQNIADKYELAGGAIINIVRYCTLKAMERENLQILLEDIEHSIIREYKKEGKIVN